MLKILIDTGIAEVLFDWNPLVITYDYQLHFVPPREYVNDEVVKFLENGYSAFQEDLTIEV